MPSTVVSLAMGLMLALEVEMRAIDLSRPDGILPYPSGQISRSINTVPSLPEVAQFQREVGSDALVAERFYHPPTGVFPDHLTPYQISHVYAPVGMTMPSHFSIHTEFLADPESILPDLVESVQNVGLATSQVQLNNNILGSGFSFSTDGSSAGDDLSPIDNQSTDYSYSPYQIGRVFAPQDMPSDSNTLSNAYPSSESFRMGPQEESSGLTANSADAIVSRSAVIPPNTTQQNNNIPSEAFNPALMADGSSTGAEFSYPPVENQSGIPSDSSYNEKTIQQNNNIPGSSLEETSNPALLNVGSSSGADFSHPIDNQSGIPSDSTNDQIGRVYSPESSPSAQRFPMIPGQEESLGSTPNSASAELAGSTANSAPVELTGSTEASAPADLSVSRPAVVPIHTNKQSNSSLAPDASDLADEGFESDDSCPINSGEVTNLDSSDQITDGTPLDFSAKSGAPGSDSLGATATASSTKPTIARPAVILKTDTPEKGNAPTPNKKTDDTSSQNTQTQPENSDIPTNLLSDKSVKPEFGFVNHKNVDGKLRKVTYGVQPNGDIIASSANVVPH